MRGQYALGSVHNEQQRTVRILILAPVLDLDIISSGSETDVPVSYGSDSSYDISIFTIPRSKIVLDIIRDGVSLVNDKRFELLTT